MALAANSYGSVSGVASYVRHAANPLATFDETTDPTIAQVEAFLDQQSAKLNGWLAAAGYTIPVSSVTAPDAKRILDYYANVGAAGLVELTRRNSGYDAESDNSRENKFLAEFNSAQAYIQSGALAKLGVTHSEAAESAAAISFVTASYGVDPETDEFYRPYAS